MNFHELFVLATDNKRPFPYQGRLAMSPWPDFLDIPTGMGKTAAVTMTWLYKRGWRRGDRTESPDSATPRRLIWCLPMRVLVEQTELNIRAWLTALGVLGEAGNGKVSVHVLMGGADDLKSWADHPDEDMILIGTQDMLLSRALMRGYGMSRYQWPVHFALLHNDALWVFDEVQLMGAGLATSAQLEAFRRSFSLPRSSRSLWLSATLRPDWLATVDMKPYLDALRILSIDDQDRQQAGKRLNAVKHIARLPTTLGKEAGNKKGLDDYLQTLCDSILEAHDPASQTLVVVNRVDRAQGLFRLLRQRRPDRPDLLVHARFRAAERTAQARRLREDDGADRIIVATQAIEAGVDLSAKVLVTELAPWSSLVQRFGRCNRYGEHNDGDGARIFWVDIEADADLLPYRVEDLTAARGKLLGLAGASPEQLPPVDEQCPPGAVLRRKDLLDLFNTDPDLSGFDVDISDYIRDAGIPGLQVFWRDFDDPNHPQQQAAPDRLELCPISIGQAKGLYRRGAWRWDGLDRVWAKLDRDPRPGMTVLLRAADGGYDPYIGFDADAKKTKVPVVETDMDLTPEAYGEDRYSEQSRAVLLTEHLAHVADQAKVLCARVGEIQHADSVIRAARWHDVGKAHAVFQTTMHACDHAPAGLLAKSPCRGRHQRFCFRHELASMLAWLEQYDHEPDADLIAYLIVAHHGKVRMSLRAMPAEQAEAGISRFARGVWEGDSLPALEFDGEHSDDIVLRLPLMELGEGEMGPSWTARTQRLLDEHGPFRLAWLETLVRIADWRASRLEQEQAAPLAGGPANE